MVLDGAQRIADTELTVDWLLGRLEAKDEDYKKLLAQGAEPYQWTAARIAQGNANNSFVYKIVIDLRKTDSEDLSHSVVLKVPTVAIYESMYRQVPNGWSEGKREQTIANVQRRHRVECQFYEEMASQLSVRVPKLFASQEWSKGRQSGGYLLMEDLSAGAVLSKYDSVSAGMVKAIVVQMAEFHAEFLAKETNLWIGRFENQIVVSELGKKFVNAEKSFLDVCGKSRDKVARLFEKIKPIAAMDDFHIWVAERGYVGWDLPTVVLHGDIWNANVVWKRDANGEATSEILGLLDWQVVGEGCPTLDIARFLLLNCDGADRRRYEATIFDFYLESLRKYYHEEITFTAETLLQCYRYNLVSQAVAFILIGNRNLFHLRHEINQATGDEKRFKQAFFEKMLGRIIHALEDVAEIIETDLAHRMSEFH